MTSRKIMGLMVAGLIVGTSAQAADGGHDHDAAGTRGQPAVAASVTAPTPAKMHQSKMKKMDGMLESAKMAKSPEEKAAMMENHMQAMHDHMKDMKMMMHAKDGNKNPDCMKHMAMMQDMMKQMSGHQMMMPGKAGAAPDVDSKHQHGDKK